MELTQRQSLDKGYWLATIKSFLIWCFTLMVCLLVVGFPLVVLMATIGALSVVVLQSVLPISSVLLVAGSIIGGNLLLVIIGAAILTFKGIHPQEVSWLRWLHGEETHFHTAVYASCPLTCSLNR
jgi:CBS-domain-containing membrane protein